MKNYLSIITLAIALLLGHGCIKDELTVGELDEGTIKDLPITEQKGNSRHICVRRKISLDIDSLLGTGAFPFLDFNLCKCDTLDLRIGKLPEDIELIGFAKAGSRTQTPSKKRLGIITNWKGQLILAQDEIGLIIPILINLNECD